MNKYNQLLSEIIKDGQNQQNKKGRIKYLLNQKLELLPIDLLEVLEGHPIARNKLKSELELFVLGADKVEEYNKVGVNWWDYCGEYIINSYPKYFEELPSLVEKVNKELRASKNYVLFLGENGVETNQQPCVSLIQFQIDQGELVISAFLRSSDASLGLPSDIYHLWLISREFKCRLKSISLFLSNVHIYENNLIKTKRLLRGEAVSFNLNV